jgi:hypothetical protein
MDIPRWIVDCVFILIVCWIVEREIKKLKVWVEELVGFARTQKTAPNADLAGDCEACGKPKAHDYADCPTCHRRFVEPGICGTKWTEAAMRSRALDDAGSR